MAASSSSTSSHYLDSPAADDSSIASPALDSSTASSTADTDDSVNSSLVHSVLNAPLYGSRAAQHDIHAYLHNKRIKLRHQYQADALTASTFNSTLTTTPTSTSSTTTTPPPLPATPTALFHSCIFWLNGLTSPPASHLLPLIYRHGGRVENKLVPVVTHCVSENLPSTKVRDWKEKGRHKRWWVVGGWVVECVRRGRMVAEWEWLVPELRDGGLRTVKGLLGMTGEEGSKGERVDEMVVDDEEAAAGQRPPSTAAQATSPTNRVATVPAANMPSPPPFSPPQRASPISAVSSSADVTPPTNRVKGASHPATARSPPPPPPSLPHPTPPRAFPTSATSSSAAAAPSSDTSAAPLLAPPDADVVVLAERPSTAVQPSTHASRTAHSLLFASPVVVPPFVPVNTEPLSFRSISTSSPTHVVPPPPPPPDYQSLLLPARPFDLNQQKSRAASRVMTSPAAATAHPLAPAASIVPPATRPYMPRAVVMAQPAVQGQASTTILAPPVPAALRSATSPLPASHSPDHAQAAATPPLASISATSPTTVAAPPRLLVPHSNIPPAASSMSVPAFTCPPTAASSSHSYAVPSPEPMLPESYAASVLPTPSPPPIAAASTIDASSSTTTSCTAPATSFTSTTSPPSSSSSPHSSILLPSGMAPTAYQGGPAPRLSGRSTLNDPHFVQTFFAASRLHFIGSWKRLFQNLIPALLSIPPRFTASAYPAPSSHRGYILHCDLDCFFASVAARDHPELNGKPVAVCHATAADPSSSANGITSTSSISSCNYVARGFGLHAEMSIGRARRMCPELVVVPYEFEKYAAASEAIYRIFFTVTHRVQAVSLDECYMELPGAMSRQEVEDVARDVRKRVETTTGVQLSIGISHSLLLARLATKAAKPNNLFYLPDDSAELKSYMANLSASDVPGIGFVNTRRLEEENITTCAQLQQLSRDKLQQMFGKKQGIIIYESCRGIDHRPLVPVKAAGEDKTAALQRSIAVNINYGIRFERDEQVLPFLLDLSDELLSRLLFTPLCAQLLSMKLMIRHPDAPLEPPKKFLGHGVCDTRSKSKPIDGRPLAEPITDRSGADDERRERDRLRSLVLDLWARLRDEWKFAVADLRGVGLQLTKMRRRDGRADKLVAFAAYGFKPVASPVKEGGVEEGVGRGADEMLVDVNGEMEEEEEWKEDGMEVDEDEEWSDERPLSNDAGDPSPADTTKPAAGSATVETASAASPPLPSLSIEAASVSAFTTSSVVSPSSLESLLQSALSMTVSPTLQHSSTSGSSPTVALPLDQLLRLLASVSQHSGLSSLSLSETLATLAGKAATLFASTNPVPSSTPSPSLALPAPPTSTSAAPPPLPELSSLPLFTPSPTSAASMPPPPPQSAVAPTTSRPLTISEVVAEVDAAKQRAYLVTLPAFASLDRSVIAALPFEVRQELANAYKQKRAMEKEEEEKAEAEKKRSVAPSRRMTPSTSAATRAAPPSSSSPSSSSSSVDLPSFSQVDPSVLADLPPSIRAELELEYKRRGAQIVTQQRSPPINTRNGKGKKAKAKQTDKGKQANKSTVVAAPSTVARPMNGVTIVDHFTAVEHEKRQQQRAKQQQQAAAAAHDVEDVEIMDWTNKEPQRGSRRQLNMEGAEQQQSRREEEKYADSVEDERARRRRERLREEKEQEQQRRERHDGSNSRATSGRDKRVTARSNSPANAPAFVVVDPSLVPRPRPPPSTAAGDSSPASPHISSIVSDGDDFVGNLHRLSARFVPTSSLQPHLSIWLRTLRTRHPHTHPTLECSCSEAVIGCFCRYCPRWQALLTFLSAQARLRNAELVAAAVAALRAARGASRLAGGRGGGVGEGGGEGGGVGVDGLGGVAGEKACVCFVCSVDVMVGELQKVVEVCYDGVLKCG